MPGRCVLIAGTMIVQRLFRHATERPIPYQTWRIVELPEPVLIETYLVTLLGSIVQHSHIVVHVKAEQRPRLSSSLVDNKIVEGIVLQSNHTDRQLAFQSRLDDTTKMAHVRDDEILFDVHHVVYACPSQFRELSSAFLQELPDVVTFLALRSVKQGSAGALERMT